MCSPPCSSSNTCPSDEPQGVTAHPQCALQSPSGGKFCALICTPSTARPNGANGECGSGTCESIQGIGLCTYAAAGSDVEVLQAGLALVGANPTHYGDPKNGCESDEQAVQVQGLPGDFCSPACSASGKCPSDEPQGVTAHPQCVLRSPTGSQYCGLTCTPSEISSNGANGECGSGKCQSIQGMGLCTYDADEKLLESAVSAVLVGANPTHYGNPKNGCEADEQAVRVQGLPGDMCSPPCSSSNTCPTDEPQGVTARPQCALQSPSGGKFCALICTPSTTSLNGANGECGSGTCQSIQGIGLCTYGSDSSDSVYKTVFADLAEQPNLIV
eukprot:TRINITY_DN1042_c0_g1_i3.p1 TRINITY_DN1042_c0_g1~~TRINITY_DN1042_c0_g1_i3.p1  ORF type:complete len:329 (-),score=42.34 TRINITY_DN1042_c0_g1_i3:111-1097(-)